MICFLKDCKNEAGCKNPAFWFYIYIFYSYNINISKEVKNEK